MVRIALLRAVNVGGVAVRMAELRKVFAGLGFADARTLLQSGNVVFDSAAAKARGAKGAASAAARKGSHKTLEKIPVTTMTGAELESLLEAETERRLKVRTDYLVRSAEEWRAIVAANPFSREAKDDPAHLVVIPLKSAPAASDVAALQEAIRGREAIHAAGRDLYAWYPDGIGRSKLTIAAIEKKLRTRGTMRNWNTALKLQAMAEEAAK